MRWSIAAAAGVVVIQGCTSLPEIEQDAITTTAIILNIKCQFRDALREFNVGSVAGPVPSVNWLIPDEERSWKAGFTLTMKTYNKGSVFTDTSLVVPLNPGSFTLGLKGGVTGDATREEKVDFTEKLIDIYNYKDCPPNASSEKRLLEGDLGFEDFLHRMSIARNDGIMKDPTSLTYNIDFSIRYNGGISPKWSLIPVGSRTFNTLFNLDGESTGYHSLKVVFSRPVRRCSDSTVEVALPGRGAEKVCASYVIALPGEQPVDVPKPSTSDERRDQRPLRPSARPVTPSADDDATQRRLDALKGLNALDSLSDKLRTRDGLSD